MKANGCKSVDEKTHSEFILDPHPDLGFFEGAFLSDPMKTSPFRTVLRKWWLPPLSFVLLVALMALTPPRIPFPHPRTGPENVAHDLGHTINSVWMGISHILLVVPSWVATFLHKRPDLWAWRALDAVLLDFLLVDALGKDLSKVWAVRAVSINRDFRRATRRWHG
ncbi:hypothetical protein B1R32_12137 [Abditibacterium utsteinense]|uniref:Uncharacterized protein n=1 Tax=Abditibacterium utsteinense TaxID=1960156 RepID=A0A2S8SPU9_9BACT|nr:hypothetical protein [Abditibacterium utsteinense]PQV62825.1 hypothetical protein B1R32_12137 [Abditibacterium utsteinense]